MKREEQALLYGIHDTEKFALLMKTLRRLGVRVREVPNGAWNEKVGFLLGMKGFQATKSSDSEGFTFPHEVMVLQNVRNKRLEAVLKALDDAGLERIRFKSVVTPFNILWTFRRLCETMQREHGALAVSNEDLQREGDI